MSPIELMARREALGLSQSRLADYLHVAQNTLSAYERGARAISDAIEVELIRLEDQAELVTDKALTILEAWPEGLGLPVLVAYRDDRDLWAAIPELDGLPAVVHRVALARVLIEWEGEPIEIVEKPEH